MLSEFFLRTGVLEVYDAVTALLGHLCFIFDDFASAYFTASFVRADLKEFTGLIASQSRACFSRL